MMIYSSSHVTCYPWCPQTPSSVFCKELALAMPRRVVYYSESAGDPQTLLQDDKDPMLTLNPDYLDCHSDTDPAGDLGENKSHRNRKVGFILRIKGNLQKGPFAGWKQVEVRPICPPKSVLTMFHSSNPISM